MPSNPAYQDGSNIFSVPPQIFESGTGNAFTLSGGGATKFPVAGGAQLIQVDAFANLRMGLSQLLPAGNN